jgi:hypothetical protein
MSSETAAMLARASPLNPSVTIRSRSASAAILLVAWRAKHWAASSGPMPEPLSWTLMSRFPPDWSSTRISVAPASSEFSTSSLTTENGRSITSPAAIF